MKGLEEIYVANKNVSLVEASYSDDVVEKLLHLY